MKLWITGIGWASLKELGTARHKFMLTLKDDPSSTTALSPAFDKPYARFHRLDDYSRLGMSAIAMTLKDADQETWTEKRNIAIVAQTVYGCLATDYDYYQTVLDNSAWPSPGLFTYTLPNCFLGDAAIHFGLTGSGFIIGETKAPDISGLQITADMLIMHEADRVLWGVCDLGTPAFMNTNSPKFPFALFFLVETPGAELLPPLIIIDIDRHGNVYHEKKQVNSLRCLLESGKMMPEIGIV